MFTFWLKIKVNKLILFTWFIVWQKKQSLAPKKKKKLY